VFRNSPIYLLNIIQRIFLVVVFSLFATISAADERFVDAIKAGDLAAIDSLIAEGVDPNTEFKPGWPPLRMAYLMKKPEMMKALINGGASVDGEWALNDTSCGKCHSRRTPGIASGEEGGVFVPHLAGQHSDYTAKQLRAFISGERAHHLEGFNLGQSYHESSILIEGLVEPIAGYVQTLDRFDNSEVTKTDNHDNGSSIYSNQCASCHGENGVDTKNTSTPQLAGLYSVYTFNTLGLFKDNKRTHSIDLTLSEEEMQSVSDYISAMGQQRPLSASGRLNESNGDWHRVQVGR